jgi:hypothetical protein
MFFLQKIKVEIIVSEFVCLGNGTIFIRRETYNMMKNYLS